MKQRWANGKGVTYEVGRRDHLQEDSRAAGGAPWVWRVSQAELVPGRSQNFSTIDGVDRTLILTQGVGITLAVEGMARESLELHRPFTFPADEPTRCDVDDPGPGGGGARDLNIMWDRSLVQNPVVDVVTNSLAVNWSVIPSLADASFAVALGGPALISHQGGALECLCDLGSCGEAVRFDHSANSGDEDSRIRVVEGKAAVFSFVPL